MLCEFYLKEQMPKYTPTPTPSPGPLNHMDAVEVASGKIDCGWVQPLDEWHGLSAVCVSRSLLPLVCPLSTPP